MRTSDVIVIGGGLAGLTAAIVAAGRGKDVTLMTSGAGTLAIGGGTIDVLGYLEDNT
ncbi:MAG: glycerol-3-phosphate dehydrogenase, anaerobic, subunit, partial [Sporomusa sp.]|nr:glycerol-3-phosphate dehydrogenase, anaerobic, subunit [Sporomusa sp.]